MKKINPSDKNTNSLYAAANSSTMQVWGHLFSKFDVDVEKKNHKHPTGILTGVEKGVVSIRTEKGSWILPPKTVAYLPPDILHSTFLMNGYSGWVLSIPKSRQKNLPKNIAVLEASELLIAAARKIVSSDPSKTNLKAHKNRLEVLFDELSAAKEAQFLQIPMPENKGLSKVAKYVIERPDDMTRVDDLASMAGMSKRTFSRHFIEETGLIFTIWRQRVKIYNALQMLSEGKTVTEITFDLGYQNVSAFIVMFRRHLGCAPKVYLSRQRE